MIYCLDMDQTLCHTEGMDYANATPNWEVIRKVQALAGQGHVIIIYTGRGNIQTSDIDWGELTYSQLRRWGIPYKKLYMTKPPADAYIDDKAQNIVDFMKEKHGI